MPVKRKYQPLQKPITNLVTVVSNQLQQTERFGRRFHFQVQLPS